jgi:hypothetical protein
VERRADLRQITTNIVPTDSDDVPPFEGSSAVMTKRSVPQQSTISKPQGVEELGIGDCDIFQYRSVIVRREFHVFVISANQAFVSFANDPSLASSVKAVEERDRRTNKGPGVIGR